MRSTRKFAVLFICIGLPCLLISGCRTGGNVKSDTDSNVSNTAEQSDPNFISAPGLTSEKINKLWDIATNKCYDFGWSVVNNDKATKNLVCQTISQGDTMTLRVKFTDEGIYLDLKSSSAAWALFGKGMGAKTTEHKEMKAAIIAGLK